MELIKNSELVKPELLLLKDGSDICLEACLRLNMLKVGIRANNLPSKEEKAVLMEFMVKNFGAYSYTQVNEAFEMAILSKLDCDCKHYESFSCEYVGRILTAYKQKLIQMGRLKSNIEKERQRLPEQKQLPGPKMSDDEVIELAHQVWKSTKNELLISINTYQALLNKGVVFSEEEKGEIRLQAKIMVANMFKTDPYLFDEIPKEKQELRAAKKIACARYFNKIDK